MGDERYSLNENLGKQLQEWLNNGGKKGRIFNGEYFDLGTTPNVLIKHGAKRSKIIMYEDVVAKVTEMKGDNAHAIPLDEIAKLPSQLNDTILLFKGSVSNSFIALTEIVDIHGNDVVVAIHINRDDVRRNKITRIASLYSKTNDYGNNRIIAYVNNQIKLGNLIDASIKKAPMWFTIRGLQLPKTVQTIIDANSSIPENSGNVNTNSQNSSQSSKNRRKTTPVRWNKQNTLYVAISLDKIKTTEVSGQGNTENGVTQNSRSVNISISKLFEKSNSNSANSFQNSNNKERSPQLINEKVPDATSEIGSAYASDISIPESFGNVNI